MATKDLDPKDVLPDKPPEELTPEDETIPEKDPVLAERPTIVQHSTGPDEVPDGTELPLYDAINSPPEPNAVYEEEQMTVGERLDRQHAEARERAENDAKAQARRQAQADRARTSRRAKE